MPLSRPKLQSSLEGNLEKLSELRQQGRGMATTSARSQSHSCHLQRPRGKHSYTLRLDDEQICLDILIRNRAIWVKKPEGCKGQYSFRQYDSISSLLC